MADQQHPISGFRIGFGFVFGVVAALLLLVVGGPVCIMGGCLTMVGLSEQRQAAGDRQSDVTNNRVDPPASSKPARKTKTARLDETNSPAESGPGPTDRPETRPAEEDSNGCLRVGNWANWPDCIVSRMLHQSPRGREIEVTHGVDTIICPLTPNQAVLAGRLDRGSRVQVSGRIALSEKTPGDFGCRYELEEVGLLPP
jgi:hypothetical protein